MNNRIAFIDFVRGLLNINPMERWSPQQAKMHPFITQQKYTGPFIPPMNLKTPQPQKSPMSSMEAQQKAEQAARQKQQAQQAAHAAQAQTGYSTGFPLGANYQASNHTQPTAPATAAAAAMYNNMYASQQPQQQPQQQQQAAPPAYSSGASQYGNQLNIMQQHAQQPAQIPSGNQYNPAQQLYAQNSQRSARQRSATMVDGVPPQIQRAASMMDPTQPIRLQPSPAYFPPPPGGIPDDQPGQGRGRRQSRGGTQYRSQNVVRTLEDRTLEDGLFNQHWA